MVENLSFIRNRHKPLCTSPYGLVTYHSNSIYLYSENEFHRIVKIQRGLKYKIASLFRITERILRKEPKYALFADNVLFVAMSNAILEINIETKTIIKTHKYREDGIHTSRLSYISHIEGFQDCVAYGEYFDNPRREEVCIYTRELGSKEFSRKFQFPPHKIRHIHTLIPDKINNCVYIFTGDSDSESGIWKATNDFKNIEPILVGNQDYRACIGFSEKDYIVFATDIPSRKNGIYSLNLKTKEVTLIKIISGSCTTGCNIGDKIFFGSTVESKEPSGTGFFNRLRYLFRRKRAAGIIDDFARLYCGSVKDGFEEILRYRKDFYPAGLCQFGRINVVPYAEQGKIYVFPQALKKVDAKLGYFSIKE